jgi:hypothetical protein
MMYDQYAEEYGPAMDQQTAMKSCRLEAHDHSYEAINGESVFQATLTMTNEFAEAHVLAFVATASHSEYES